MKAVFVSYYQAFHQEVLDILDKLEIRGFTFWDEVQGRGTYTGEPHYGDHTWPTLNSAMLLFLDDNKAKPLMEELYKLNLTAEQQGLRAFVMPVEDMIFPQ